MSLLTLSLSAGGMPDEKLFRIEGKTELFKIVDNPNTLAVHFHTRKKKRAMNLRKKKTHDTNVTISFKRTRL